MAQEMAQQLELPLPEINTEDFERSWIRFNLVAVAKKWDEAKQLSIVPALLRGKLVEIFVDLEGEEKANIKTLKRALSARVGLTSDPLATARRFNDWKQEPGEKVSNYAFRKKLQQQPDGLSPQLVFPVRARGTLSAKLSVKRQRASPEGARRLAQEEMKHHKPEQPAALGVNSVLRVGGTIGALQFQFLLDSGAAVSFIRRDKLPESTMHLMEQAAVSTVGANGLPMNVVGQISFYLFASVVL